MHDKFKLLDSDLDRVSQSLLSDLSTTYGLDLRSTNTDKGYGHDMTRTRGHVISSEIRKWTRWGTSNIKCICIL